VRSRAAAAVLEGAGFRDVASLEGGIQAWNGLVASGPPEAGMAHFAAAVRPEELIALAWYLEAGSRAFYAGLGSLPGDRDAAALFAQLAHAEESHMEQLRGHYLRVAGTRSAAAFPRGIMRHEPPDALMEGGVAVAQALDWSRGKPPAELLEFCISLETNSYDLYLRMLAATPDRESRGVFDLLAGEERQHLQRLTARFEQLTDAGDGAAGGPPA
jgi:rubrerythrin